jgi:hypothetical protein
MEEDHPIERYPKINSFSSLLDLFDPAIFILLAGVGLNFFRFLRSRGISREENLVVLSAKDHYAYDKDELKNVRILINLRKLNLIKHLDIFLSSLVRILPPNTSFIGYFSDGGAGKGSILQLSRVILPFRRLLRLFDSGTNHVMDRNDVMDLLWKNGFKTIEMKEINGLTYFISQNVLITSD